MDETVVAKLIVVEGFDIVIVVVSVVVGKEVILDGDVINVVSKIVVEDFDAVLVVVSSK